MRLRNLLTIYLFNMNQLPEILEIISDNGDKILFDTAVICKDSPHHDPFRCWGVWVNDGRLFLMDSNQRWHEWGPEQGNSHLVLQSIYQRLRIQYATDKTCT